MQPAPITVSLSLSHVTLNTACHIPVKLSSHAPLNGHSSGHFIARNLFHGASARSQTDTTFRKDNKTASAKTLTFCGQIQSACF